MSDKTKLPSDGISLFEITKTSEGEILQVSLNFGPHHFLDLRVDRNGKIKFALGCTHHGFEVDASEIDSELYHVIEEVRANHRDKKIEDMPETVSPEHYEGA